MWRLWMLVVLAGMLATYSGAAAPSSGAGWPQWRGPHRDGVTPESSGWSKGWPPRVLWRANVGFGISSPLIYRDRVYTVGYGEGSGDHVDCLDGPTGRVLWSQSYPSPRHTRKGATHGSMYKGPMATPAIDVATGFLYTLSCDGMLCCWDTGSRGKQRWAVPISDRYHIQDVEPEFNGFVPSPLLYGDWVIVGAGASEGNLLAFDKSTGAFRWASASRDPMGIGSPAAMMVDGIPCVAAITRQTFLLARMDGGHLGESLLVYPWPSQYAENAPSPVVAGGKVFITMCESSGEHSALLTPRMAFSGHLRTDYVTKDFYTCTSTAALYRGYLYFRSGKRVRCVELASGKVMWSSPDLFVENHGMGAEVGNLLVAAGDGKLLIWDGERGGDLALAVASPAAPYHELARIKGVLTRGMCYPQVALGDRRIVCRNSIGDLVCLSVAAR